MTGRVCTTRSKRLGLTGEPFLQSIECTRKRGVTVFVGHAPDNTPLEMDARILLYEKSIIGCYYGSAAHSRGLPSADRVIQGWEAEIGRVGFTNLSRLKG